MQIQPSPHSPALIEDLGRFMDRLENAKRCGGNEYDALDQQLIRKGYDIGYRRYQKHLAALDDPKVIRKEILDWAKNTVAADLGIYLFMLGDDVFLVTNKDQVIGLLSIPVERGGVVLKASLHGHVELVKEFSIRFDQVYPEQEVPKINRALITRRQNGEQIAAALEPVPIKPPVANIHTFFPYFNRTPAQIWEAFAKSKSNILLLMGPPGTGKSSFALEMMNTRGWDEQVYLTDREDVLTHKGLADFIRSLKQGSVLILEDADRLLLKREDGNNVMSMLLNSTSGIMPVDVKLVVAVNLKSLNQVDEAFLRPGRCFDILKFSSLTQDQAYAARQTVGLPQVAFDPKYKQLTLAEALNYSEIANLTANGPTAIGF